jgi:hypothetical protein
LSPERQLCYLKLPFACIDLNGGCVPKAGISG